MIWWMNVKRMKATQPSDFLLQIWRDGDPNQRPASLSSLVSLLFSSSHLISHISYLISHITFCIFTLFLISPTDVLFSGWSLLCIHCVMYSCKYYTLCKCIAADPLRTSKNIKIPSGLLAHLTFVYYPPICMYKIEDNCMTIQYGQPPAYVYF